MPRLMDFMMADGSAQDIGIDKIPLIVIDNAAHYWYEDSEKDGGIWNLRTDFPNLAPPFNDFFMEFHAPNDIMFGCRVTSHETDNYWDCEIEVFMKLKTQKTLRADASWYIKVDREGKLLNVSNDRVNPLSGKKQSLINVLCEPDYYEMSQNIKVLAILPAFFSISLMHCKNVEMKTQIPSMPLSRKYEKKHGVPLVKYKILDIEPIKRILRLEGKSKTNGMKYALHICRGHFKDYTEHGLFGKYKGMYWWDSHVRGDLSHGAIVKDYNVNAPVNRIGT